MNLVFFATQSNYIFPIKQAAWLLGFVMDFIFNVLDRFGMGNIALSIIAFTIIINLLMLPMTIKQQKFTKLNAVMMPEIKAIQDKYKGKTQDQDAMMKQNAEIQAVYKKYGTSPTGSCLYLLIQMPILFGLYQVIYKIPGYVGKIKGLYQGIVNTMMISLNNGSVSFEDFNNFYIKYYNYQKKNPLETLEALQGSQDAQNHIIDMLYTLPFDGWNDLYSMFGPAFKNTIAVSMEAIDKMNQFFGINLSQTPWYYVSNFKTYGVICLVVAILIPVLSALSQFISTKLMTAANSAATSSGSKSDDNPAEQSMKMMNNFMPLLSLFMCFTLPSGLGVYWVASSVVRTLIQLIVNAYLKRMDVEELVKKNIEKNNKKREKRGLAPQSISNITANNIRNIQNQESVSSEERLAEYNRKKEEREKKIKEASEYYSKTSTKKKGSLASKANMVQQYNDKYEKK